jgi:hypothetical protein
VEQTSLTLAMEQAPLTLAVAEIAQVLVLELVQEPEHPVVSLPEQSGPSELAYLLLVRLGRLLHWDRLEE